MSIGMVEYLSGQYESVIATFGTMLNPEPDIEAYRAACFAQLDRGDEAAAAVKSFRDQNRANPLIKNGSDPESWREFWADFWRFKNMPSLDSLLGFLESGDR